MGGGGGGRGGERPPPLLKAAYAHETIYRLVTPTFIENAKVGLRPTRIHQKAAYIRTYLQQIAFTYVIHYRPFPSVGV